MPCPGAGVRHRSSAELRNPRRGGSADGTTKALVGRLAGARCPALRSRRPFRLADGVPARPCLALRGAGFLCAGVVGGPNPACGPHAKKALRPAGRKKRKKRRFRQKDCLRCLLFKGIRKIFVFAKTPTPGREVTKVLRIYIVRERRTFYELSPPK